MSAELRALLAELYTEAEIEVWLRTPQPLFGNRIASNMIAAGDEQKLIHGLRMIFEGAYT